jgi:hypothetical protein
VFIWISFTAFFFSSSFLPSALKQHKIFYEEQFINQHLGSSNRELSYQHWWNRANEKKVKIRGDS